MAITHHTALDLGGILVSPPIDTYRSPAKSAVSTSLVRAAWRRSPSVIAVRARNGPNDGIHDRVEISNIVREPQRVPEFMSCGVLTLETIQQDATTTTRKSG